MVCKKLFICHVKVSGLDFQYLSHTRTKTDIPRHNTLHFLSAYQNATNCNKYFIYITLFNFHTAL